MDDIERIQKISAMSEELKRFGFSNNTLDAIEGAKGLVMSEEEQQESMVFSDEDAVTELTNSFRRYRENTDKQMQEMQRNMLQLHTHIKELLEMVSELKTRNNAPQERPSPSYSTETPSSPKPETTETEVSGPQAKPETAETHVSADQENPAPQVEEPKPIERQERSQTQEKPYYEKQGSYSPENVKIEDFFYYGHK